MIIGNNTNLPTYYVGNTNGSMGQELGRDDFLSMLLVQLRYQDPLNVMSQSEFTSQLAQFSSLEQLQQINGNITSSLNANALLTNSLNNSLATTLIDRTVKAHGNSLYLEDGQSATCAFDLSEAADKVTISIYDEDGDLVATIDEQDLGQGQHVVAWDGKDDGGRRLSSGEYTFKVEAFDGNQESVDVDVYIMGRVEAVKYQAGSAVLVVDGLEVELSDVFEILGMGDVTEENGG